MRASSSAVRAWASTTAWTDRGSTRLGQLPAEPPSARAWPMRPACQVIAMMLGAVAVVLLGIFVIVPRWEEPVITATLDAAAALPGTGLIGAIGHRRTPARALAT